jgi:hypothetical protein
MKRITSKRGVALPTRMIPRADITHDDAILAIDPGARGGIAVMRMRDGAACGAPLPQTTATAVSTMASMMAHRGDWLIDHAFIAGISRLVPCLKAALDAPRLILGATELPFAGPIMSKASAISLGVQVGSVLAAIAAQDAPYMLMTPQIWQADTIASYEYTDDKKQRSCLWADDYGRSHLIVSWDKDWSTHDGVCDAIAMAAFIRAQILNPPETSPS